MYEQTLIDYCRLLFEINGTGSKQFFPSIFHPFGSHVLLYLHPFITIVFNFRTAYDSRSKTQQGSLNPGMNTR